MFFYSGEPHTQPKLRRSLSGALRSAADSAQEQCPRLRPLQAVRAVPGEGLALIERDFAHLSPMFLRTSVIWEGNGNPLQYSCLENPMDVEAWWATVHGVAKSWIRLSDFTFTFTVKFAQTFVYRDHYIYCFEEQKNLPSALRRNRFSASQVCFLYILKR